MVSSFFCYNFVAKYYFMEENHELELAWQVIENTGTHLFLTGKAGTGKTTFLRRLKELTPKRMVVVAPTGIAAINAGGVTIHSFFQLTFPPCIPECTFNSAHQSYHKFGKEKINIIRSMDLLVIDEISMVRADQNNGVHAVLRRYRDRSKPFGGVQLLMIGDLQQLAPVVKEEDWNLLTSYYDTAFFFGSHSLKETEYITIELKKVYRQSDTAFVGLLNKIRDKEADESVLEELNKRYLPEFRPREEEGYIRLTTHNYQAQQYNDRQLLSLSGRAFSFQARVEGTFPESAYPADEMLTVKEGAQIMFIKNDSSGEHRYYNGMIGLVTAVGKDGIRVKGNGESQDFLLETEEWTNSKYSLNPQTKEITEEVEGTFRQYPIRLAWAITIHKSQGLTFERAIIDANASFAHGQVYVALSRCKSLQGLVLSSPLRRESIISDDTIDEFTRNAGELTPDKHKLALLRQHYFYELLCEQFDFHPLEQHFARVLRLLDEHLYRLYPKLLERYKETIDLYKAQIMKVADTFKLQYSTLLMEVEDYDANPKLNERIVAGAHYFRKHLEDLLNPLMVSTKVETDNKELKKKFSEALDTLKTTLHVKLGTLYYTEKEGFTVSAFLKHKAVLTLSVSGGESTSSSGRSERKPRTAEKIEVPTDILHPELYKQLIAWRNSEASKANLPVYTVIQQKAILGIVNLLPCDTASLVRIPYFGKRGAEKYGDVLLEMVSRYVKEQGIERPPMPAITLTLKKETKEQKEPKPLKENKPVKEPKLDTKEITYRLFRQGKNIEEIAKERELVSGTIAGHLEHYVRLGAVKIEQLVPKEKIMKITRYVQANGSDKGLTAIKAALGDEVSYADIRLVLAAGKKES